MSNPMIDVQGLRKTFHNREGKPIHAVKGVDLTIHEGEIFSLLGPNGAGKTTLISMMSGLLAPSEGDAVINGHSIRQEPLKAKASMGIVPQEIALYPTISARRNLSFFGQMYDLGGDELKRRIDEILAFVDLTGRQHDRIETFSGGMKRRVNIGVGLLHRPRLVFMDEPTVGIDPQNRRRILDMVVQLRDDFEMTVIYTTHYMEEAQELSDRVGIIDHGEIIALGSQPELTAQVGEEDRIVFTLASETVPEGLPAQIEARVEGVKRVLAKAAPESADAERRPGDDEPEGGKAAQSLHEAQLTVFARNGRHAMPQVISVLNELGVPLSSVDVREPDLEAVFLHLTGRALRDAS